MNYPAIGKLYQWTPCATRGGLELTRVSEEAPVCGLPLECGSSCCLAPGHEGECSCCGDYEKPGDCPA